MTTPSLDGDAARSGEPLPPWPPPPPGPGTELHAEWIAVFGAEPSSSSSPAATAPPDPRDEPPPDSGATLPHGAASPEWPADPGTSGSGRFRFADGSVVSLQGPLLLGRNPPADRLLDGRRAQPVRVADPGRVLSRCHLEVRVTSDGVDISDPGSVNATEVVPPAGPAIMLAPGVAHRLSPGSRVRMADAVEFTYEVA